MGAWEGFKATVLFVSVSKFCVMISHVTSAACIPFLLSDSGMLNCKYKNAALV